MTSVMMSAGAIAQHLQWLAQEPGLTGRYVKSVAAEGDAVRIVVQDPNFVGPSVADDDIADSAASVLRDAILGHRLIVSSPGGHIGQAGNRSPEVFGTNIPGVRSQATESEDAAAPDGSSFTFSVGSEHDAARLREIVRPEISDVPSRVLVE